MPGRMDHPKSRRIVFYLFFYFCYTSIGLCLGFPTTLHNEEADALQAVAAVRAAADSPVTVIQSPAYCEISLGDRCTVELKFKNGSAFSFGVFRKGESVPVPGGIIPAGNPSDSQPTFAIIRAEILIGENIFEIQLVAGDGSRIGEVLFELKIQGKPVATTTTTTTSTTIPTTTSTIPTGTGLQFFADKTSCTIRSGDNFCSVELRVQNPDGLSLWIDRIDPRGDRITFTGTFNNSGSFAVPWITQGTYTFILKDAVNADKEYARLTVVGIGAATTTTTSVSTSTTLDGKPRLVADSLSCQIPTGQSRCSVSLRVSNPERLPLLVDRLATGLEKKTITGVITTTSFTFQFDWITEGSYVFVLYHATANTEYDFVIVIGQVSGTTTTSIANTTTSTTLPSATDANMTTSTEECIVPAGGTCSVTLQVTNPSRQSLQVRVIDPQVYDKALTGVFNDASFSIHFPWIQAGTYQFSLYETLSSRLLRRLSVTGRDAGVQTTTTSTATTSTTATTTSTSTTTSTTLSSSASMTILPQICGIPTSGGRCSVTVQVINPGYRSLQLWVQGPSDAQEKAMTGTFTDGIFSAGFGWVTVGTTTFRLYDVTGGGKALKASATAVGVGKPVIEAFAASSSTIRSGESTILSWRVTGADSCSLSPGMGTQSCTGAQTIWPTETTTFTLTAVNLAGSVTGQTKVTVTAGWTAGQLYAVDPIVGNLRYVPAGMFTQGSPESEIGRSSDEGPQFQHTLTKNLAVMETEVTRQMWADLRAAQSSLPADPTDMRYGSGMNNPVQNVTWYEAVFFANLLSQQRGLQRVYYADSSFTVPIGSANYQTDVVYANWSADGYRLSTEGEWEYYTRAGSTNPFSILEPAYNSSTWDNCSTALSALDSVAWYWCNSQSRSASTSVGTKASNPWGLKDVHGNVWEWVWDWHSETSYSATSQTDFRGPSTGTYRVVRGGSWTGFAVICRSAFRDGNSPANRNFILGFRLARSVDSSGPVATTTTTTNSTTTTTTTSSTTTTTSTSTTTTTLPSTVFYGALDSPKEGAVVTTSLEVSGWALSNYGVSRVAVFLDGISVGYATYGTSRLDVCSVYPSFAACASSGYRLTINVVELPTGSHTLQVCIRATNGQQQLIPGQPVHFIKSTGLVAGQLYATDTIVGNLRYVPAGMFTQGSPESEIGRSVGEGPQFQHTLTKNLAVMETEVTLQMWADLRTAQSSLPADPTDTRYGSGMSNPVQNVTWYEAVLFANLLSQQRGLQRVYYADSSFTVPIGSANYQTDAVYANWSADGYRLPTEGEWEYFTRAGSTSPFSILEPAYNSSTWDNCSTALSALDSVAWYWCNSQSRFASAPAGTKASNPWGLKDVHGNVWEWVWDWYSETGYSATSQTDFRGPSTGRYRVRRGGGWLYNAGYCRSADREWYFPNDRLSYLGFRLARVLS